ERGHRTWTRPYTFYPDFRTGITRAEPVYDAGGAVLAVITADYDVSELSEILSQATRARDSLVLFTTDGVVLGLSGLKAPPRPNSDGRPLSFDVLGRPELRAFYESRGAKGAAPLREYFVGREAFVASEHHLRGVQGLDWRLALILPKETITAAARAQARKELWLAGAVVLFAVAIACGLSVGIQRLRKARARAEAQSERVMGKLRELGAYTLEEQLGSGGMGEVYRARHRMLARPAAIKLIRTDMPKEEREALELRFDREAKVLSELRSPHTVAILDYGRTTDDRLFIVMELLTGLPLDKLVEKHGPQPAARVIPILVGVCRSLAEAHAAGIVHRDIKPANLFLCHDAEGVEIVKVLDFGLAKAARKPGLTSEGHVAGTPHFMPPEQALGREVDGRADLYALGCTAHFLLTGRTVFEEPSDIAVILAHQMKAPPPLAEHTTAWLPDGMEALIQRCLAKDPEFRPVSAAALARALLSLRIPEEQQLGAETWRDWWLRFENLPGAVAPS
ncbi:MAG TPA: serine/threonine protein kinase, partial [Polyangiaceae bacterium]|nr:serine/threonine protein kinase [Polyangiaceae bacterium]